MTNEELVIEIKNGKTEYLPALWKQVERFVALKASKITNVLEDNRIEFGDLYNSAYLYLQKAVDYYNPDFGVNFLTIYIFFIRSAFREALGIKTLKACNEPIKHAISLDTPIKEGETATLGDTIADDIDIEEKVTHDLWGKDLHSALEKALSTLSPIEEEVIRLRYYDKLTYEQIGKKIGFSRGRSAQIEGSALHNLRTPENIRSLEQYIDFRTNFYLGTSVKSQLSPVELLIVRREEMREQFSNRRNELLKRIGQS